MTDRPIDRPAFLVMVPSVYLEHGYRDASGQPRPELSGTFATAACIQLEESEVSPQELSGTLEALRQTLPWHHETEADEQLRNAVEEALEVTAAMYNQANNPGIVSWLDECVDFVKTQGDVPAFMTHFSAVVWQYSLVAKRTAG